jgi:precorrin-2 dehydrogenase/sirohydrochlorin ferrochelatase
MQETPLYPLFLRLLDRPVLVVGGGPVAFRKVRSLMATGARVTLVAPEAVPALAALAEGESIHWERRPFRLGDVQGQDLVFTATGSPETDTQVIASAHAQKIWVNAADDNPDLPDDPEDPGTDSLSPTSPKSDFLVPATFRRGPLALAVSTGGAAPGFAARLVRELSATLSTHLGSYVSLLGELRAELFRRFPDAPEERKAAFGAALDSGEARQLAESGDLDTAREMLERAACSDTDLNPK